MQAVQRSLLALPRHERALAACEQAPRAPEETDGASARPHSPPYGAITRTYFDFSLPAGVG